MVRVRRTSKRTWLRHALQCACCWLALAACLMGCRCVHTQGCCICGKVVQMLHGLLGCWGGAALPAPLLLGVLSNQWLALVAVSTLHPSASLLVHCRLLQWRCSPMQPL